MEDFKFLTTIDGIYSKSAVKIIDSLNIYCNFEERSFKVIYKNVMFINDLVDIENGEMLLKFGYCEFDFIYNNIDNIMIKKLIYSKFQDFGGNVREPDEIR